MEDIENCKEENEQNYLEIFNKKYNENLSIDTNNILITKKNIGNEGFKLLSQIPFNNIELIISLNLSENNISDITPLLKMDLSNLRTLNLSNNRIEEIEIFGQLNLSHLVTLNLVNNKLKEFKVLSKINIFNLHHLFLGLNRINDINALEFMCCPNLQTIDLYQNEIKDITVFERIKFPQLRELSFANNYFDHEIIKNHDIISNLRKKGCNVIIWGTIKQVLIQSSLSF